MRQSRFPHSLALPCPRASRYLGAFARGVYAAGNDGVHVMRPQRRMPVSSHASSVEARARKSHDAHEEGSFRTRDAEN